MANLPEQAIWTPGVYQFESTDPVEGGPDGIDNKPLKDLTNRTFYLKDEVEKRAPLIDAPLTGTPTAPTAAPGTNTAQLATAAFVKAAVDAAIAGIMNAPPEALDTLNELAEALGDDPNFATTVMNALALKAPIASPSLTGLPKAPTRTAGDNSTNIATTEYALNEIINEFTRSGQQIVAQSGYQRLPGALILQWGRATATVSTGAVSFPISFPNIPLSIVTTDIADDADASYYVSVDLVGTTASQFAFNSLRLTTGVSGDPGIFYWVAVGY